MTINQFLEDKSIPEPNTGCFLWTGPVNYKGYGFGSFEGIRFGAHRMSYIVHNGAIPKGMLVCHNCDQRSCINPNHLFLGTHQDNTDDMMRKGRHKVIDSDRGQLNRFSKLKNEDVLQIRDLGKLGAKAQVIATMFGVTDRNIYDILAEKTWKHLLPEIRLAINQDKIVI